MDENNYKHDHCWLCEHPVFKSLLVSLLVFLGAFCAFYVVSDWHFKRMMDPAVQMRRMERAMMKDQYRMDRFAKRAVRDEYRAEESVAKYIHVDRTPNAYKVIVDLKPFDNNERNVEVSSDDNTLFVSAAGEKFKKDKTEVIKYSQSFTFGENVEMDKISKTKEGNFYVIWVPIKK